MGLPTRPPAGAGAGAVPGVGPGPGPAELSRLVFQRGFQDCAGLDLHRPVGQRPSLAGRDELRVLLPVVAQRPGGHAFCAFGERQALRHGEHGHRAASGQGALPGDGGGHDRRERHQDDRREQRHALLGRSPAQLGPHPAISTMRCNFPQSFSCSVISIATGRTRSNSVAGPLSCMAGGQPFCQTRPPSM